MSTSALSNAGRHTAAAFTITLAGLLAGCSGDSGVLARVNRHPITVETFNEVARGNAQQLQGHPDSVKARLLRDLVDRELLVQAALSLGLDRTPEFQRFRHTVEDQIIKETLYQRLVGGPFPVSEAEVRAIYDRRGTATRGRLIYAADEATIRQAWENLMGGEDFALVADRYNPTGMVPPGGDIGFLQPGTLLAPLDEILRTGTIGKLYGPVAASTEGWFILRIEERRPEAQPPLEQIRAQLGEMLRQRKQRLAIAHAIDRLRAEYQVTVVPGAPQLMSGRLRPVPGDAPTPQTPPPPSAEERGTVLARYQGGTYTLGEAYDELIGGQGGRIDFAMIPTVHRWIQAQTIERAAVVEARRRHIGDEPAVQRRIRERLNNDLLDGFYQAQVIARIQIEREDFRVAYERYRAALVRLQSAHVLWVTVTDSAAAAALAAQAGQAPSLRDAAATAGLGVRVSEESLTFPSDSPLWTRFEDRIATMLAGEIAGPFTVDGRWLVFQLRDKVQEAPAFEDLPAGVLGQLQGVAAEVKREARLRALTDSLRQAFAPVIVHTDRLRRLPWPPAGAGPAGG